jgi:glucokinase
MIGITMGTGVGGGIVINEKLFHGHTGYAGEFGHMLLRPGQVPYKEAIESHIRGEVEQFLSGTAMGKRCVDASNPDEYLQGEVCEFMHPEIYKEITWLCTNLIHTLDPSVIVFGGSAGRALGPHLSKIETELKNWLLPGTPVPVLKIAELKDAAVRGAALLTQV